MPKMSRDEARALSQDERDLANAARYPTLGQMGHADLVDLNSRLRARRDRASDVGRRQRRAANGKSAPQGGAPAASGRGMGEKHHYLTAALRRVAAEMKKRAADKTGAAQGGESRKTQKTLSRQALKLKEQGAETAPARPETRSKNRGMQKIEHTDQAPSGAFDHAGARPARERSNAR